MVYWYMTCHLLIIVIDYMKKNMIVNLFPQKLFYCNFFGNQNHPIRLTKSLKYNKLKVALITCFIKKFFFLRNKLHY